MNRQNLRVLNHLQKFGSITAMQAVTDLGIMRLGARIFDLRAAGHRIRTERLSITTRFGDDTYPAEYHYEGPP